MLVTSFKARSDLHISRKLWHSMALLVIIVFYHNLDRMAALRAMAVGALLFIAVDLIRLKSHTVNRYVVSVFGPFMRKHEVNSLAGTTYMAIGILIIAFIFPKPIVKLTLFFLAVGDPVASYFGLRYGRDRIVGNKTLQGSIAAFVACTIIAFIFYSSANIMTDRLLVATLLSGLIGALGELIPFGKMDDNFTFPLVSAFGLYGLFYLFGAWG